jgi:hypothetical protein
MAQETDDGIAYLKALKQSSAAQPGTATAPAKEPAPEQRPTPVRESAYAAEQFQGAEKRRSPRYKCEGSTEIREEGCDVRTWATFTDISLHGCYVEAQATYPVGTILHMKLEANGARVEAKGNVRVSYPYLGMGIAFIEMSEQDSHHLKELLGRISRPSVILGPGIVSSLPSSAPLDGVPLISDSAAALRAFIEFFETRHMLTREDFLRILSKSQSAPAKQ